MLTKILVVDDSKLQCTYTANVCQTLAPGAHIERCFNGAEALDHLRQHTMDLVVLDLEMPVMDGVLLARHIGDEKLASAIIICSSKDPMLIATVGSMCEANGQWVLGTLQKPIQQNLLQQCLEKFELGQPEDTDAYSAETIASHFSHEELVYAIENDQIQLYFQPKLTTQGIMIKGVEALARWQHSRSGFIPPFEFITYAEQHQLIDQLTFSIVQKALNHFNVFDQRGLKLTISINLSPQSLSSVSFGEQLVQLVLDAKVDPKRVIFEVTENMLMGDIATSLQTLARLRLNGFGVAIDDYGTGFANAELLARLPATELKIDRSLVDGATGKWQQRQVLESTIGLAQNLKLTTVAEGVEQLEDLELLQSLGVELVQGFLFAKPMEANALWKWTTADLRIIRDTLTKK